MVPIVFKVGLATTTPPEAALYHVTVCPDVVVITVFALRVCIGDNSHCVIVVAVAIGAVGAALIVNVMAVLEYDGQVPSFDSP